MLPHHILDAGQTVLPLKSEKHEVFRWHINDTGTDVPDGQCTKTKGTRYREVTGAALCQLQVVQKQTQDWELASVIAG